MAKVLDQKVKVILIVVPWWPSKAFFTMLQSMIIDCPRIRLSRDMITDMVSGLPPPECKQSRLVICEITGESRSNSRFHFENSTVPHSGK